MVECHDGSDALTGSNPANAQLCDLEQIAGAPCLLVSTDLISKKPSLPVLFLTMKNEDQME